MRVRAAGAAALVALLALGGTGAPLLAAPAAHPVAAEVVAPGLIQERWVVPGASTAVHVARRDAGSPSRLQLVQAHDAVGRGAETPSSMCRRTPGCLLAVNGDFFTTAGTPLGAVVVNGRMLRSPRVDHEQLSLDPLRVTTAGLGDGGWSGEVQLPDGRPPLRLHGVNVGLPPGQLVLYTSALGATTPPCTCIEVRLREDQLPAGTLGRPVPVTPIGQGSGGSPLLPGTAVLAGSGAAAEALQGLLAAPAPLVLWVTTTEPTLHNVGVHPVLLRDGRPQAYDLSDPMLAQPHPRTLLGWDARGTVWLVASDGRRPGAPGLTAEQAISFLQSLGATDAVMLDGGGSTTFVSRGRVVSTPSDGVERPVANAVVLSSVEPPPVMAVRSAASPSPVAAVAAAPTVAPPAVPSQAEVRPAAPSPTSEPAEAPSPRAAEPDPPVAPDPQQGAVRARRAPPVDEFSSPAAPVAAATARTSSAAVPQLVAAALVVVVSGACVRALRVRRLPPQAPARDAGGG